LVGFLQTALVAVIFERDRFHELLDVKATDLGVFFYSASVLAIGHMILLHILERNQVSVVSMFFLLTPFVSAILAHFLLGEAMSVPLIIGGIITCAGVALANMGRILPRHRS
jgi:drug/metabolite transporter (DMT)-like permease